MYSTGTYGTVGIVYRPEPNPVGMIRIRQGSSNRTSTESETFFNPFPIVFFSIQLTYFLLGDVHPGQQAAVELCRRQDHQDVGHGHRLRDQEVSDLYY